MTEEQARGLAEILGGDPWQSGGDMWVLLKKTGDGRVISITDECVVEYASEEAHETNKQKNAITIV